MSPRAQRQSPQKKTVPKQGMLATLGVNAVERIVTTMGFVWRPRTILDVGLDGDIEIRDPQSGAMTGAFIGVQVKASEYGGQLGANDEFSYVCEDRDLDYWMSGNLPVVLAVYHVDRDEVYWIDIKSYFTSPVIRRKRQVLFSRSRHLLTTGSGPDLARLGLPPDRGVYLAPHPKPETLISNLLPVITYPTWVFVAPTSYATDKEMWEYIRSRGLKVGDECFVKGGLLHSVHDLADPPWDQLCDGAARDKLDANEWASSKDPDTQRDFVRILQKCLNARTAMLGLRRHTRPDYHYVSAPEDRLRKSRSYSGLNRQGKRVVFEGYPSKRDPRRIAYYRHAAFESEFLRLETGQWCLAINPTYHFTTDGWMDDPYREQRLAGIKRLDRNPAVLAYLLLWSEWLSAPKDLFRGYEHLHFGSLLKGDAAVGIIDNDWSTMETDDVARAMRDETNLLL